MNIQNIKKWDKTSNKYRFAKWLYINFLFYFINIDRFGSPKFIPTIIAGQELDAGLAYGFIKPKDGVVIDVGAERGEFAYFFYYLGFKVYAIEPEKKNNVFLWLHNWLRVILGRFRINRLACNETAGTASLHISDLSYRHSLETSQFTGNNIQKVKQVRIGDFINQKRIKKIALLKIDAEGFDLPILKGLFNSTAIRPKAIMFESDATNTQQLVSLMQANGYNYFRVIARWPEAKNLPSQKRICIYDGLDPEIYKADNNNIICMQTDFRPNNPLNLSQ